MAKFRSLPARKTYRNVTVVAKPTGVISKSPADLEKRPTVLQEEAPQNAEPTIETPQITPETGVVVPGQTHPIVKIEGIDSVVVNGVPIPIDQIKMVEGVQSVVRDNKPTPLSTVAPPRFKQEDYEIEFRDDSGNAQNLTMMKSDWDKKSDVEKFEAYKKLGYVPKDATLAETKDGAFSYTTPAGKSFLQEEIEDYESKKEAYKASGKLPQIHGDYADGQVTVTILSNPTHPVTYKTSDSYRLWFKREDDIPVIDRVIDTKTGKDIVKEIGGSFDKEGKITYDPEKLKSAINTQTVTRSTVEDLLGKEAVENAIKTVPQPSAGQFTNWSAVDPSLSEYYISGVPYKEGHDGYDIARYLRENPNKPLSRDSEKLLLGQGFTQKDIDEAKAFNKQITPMPITELKMMSALATIKTKQLLPEGKTWEEMTPKEQADYEKELRKGSLPHAVGGGSINYQQAVLGGKYTGAVFKALGQTADVAATQVVPFYWTKNTTGMKPWEIALNTGLDLLFVAPLIGKTTKVVSTSLKELRPSTRALIQSAKTVGNDYRALDTEIKVLNKMVGYSDIGEGAQTLRSETPTPQPNYTRLFRGTGSGGKSGIGQESLVGQWFTTEKNVAEKYSFLKGGELKYIDLPTKELPNYKVDISKLKGGEEWLKGTYNIPPDIVDTYKPISLLGDANTAGYIKQSNKVELLRKNYTASLADFSTKIQKHKTIDKGFWVEQTADKFPVTKTLDPMKNLTPKTLLKIERNAKIPGFSNSVIELRQAEKGLVKTSASTDKALNYFETLSKPPSNKIGIPQFAETEKLASLKNADKLFQEQLKAQERYNKALNGFNSLLEARYQSAPSPLGATPPKYKIVLGRDGKVYGYDFYNFTDYQRYKWQAEPPKGKSTTETEQFIDITKSKKPTKVEATTLGTTIEGEPKTALAGGTTNPETWQRGGGGGTETITKSPPKTGGGTSTREVSTATMTPEQALYERMGPDLYKVIFAVGTPLKKNSSGKPAKKPTTTVKTPEPARVSSPTGMPGQSGEERTEIQKIQQSQSQDITASSTATIIKTAIAQATAQQTGSQTNQGQETLGESKTDRVTQTVIKPAIKIPTPAPVKTKPPPENPPPEKKPPKPPIVTLEPKKKEGKEESINFPEGTIAWKQGIGWWVLPPPYDDKDAHFSIEEPQGVKLLPNATKAFETLQSYGGRVPKMLTFNRLGIVRAEITSPPRSPSSSSRNIKFLRNPDVQYKRVGRMYVTRMGKGVVLSNRKLNIGGRN